MKIVKKGWGCEKIIHNSDGYCGKILVFNKNKKCSYHYHKLKTETFYCQGRVLIIYGYDNNIENADRKILEKGDVFHVPVGMRHQMIALEDSELFEFSTTDFEDDSIKIVHGD